MGSETKLSVTYPKSLLDQCTVMVATHLDLVESFVGLPSLIGERIFSVGCHAERFKFNVEYSSQAVKLFADAYGEEFLSSLSVGGEHLGLNYSLEQILLFTDLVQLDVSNCGLGDDHEMLTHFQHLHRLEVLSLRANAISDIGIQKMTAPYRMFARGPAGIQRLDLRGNEKISRKCLKYLTEFKLLSTVLFSEFPGTELKMYGRWTLSEGEIDMDINTVGWAKVLIDRWMMEAKQKSMKTQPKTKTGAFSVRKYPLLVPSSISSTSSVAGNHEYSNVVARRLKVPGMKAESRSETGRGQIEGGKDLLDKQDTEAKCNGDQIEDLYKMYGDNDKSAEDEKPLMERLELYDNDGMNADKSLRPGFGRSGNREDRFSKSFSVKTAQERLKTSKLETVKANPFKNNCRADNSVSKNTGSSHKTGIKGRVSSVKTTVQDNAKISSFFTSTQSIVTKKDRSDEIQSSESIQSVNCEDQSNSMQSVNYNNQSSSIQSKTSVSSVNTSLGHAEVSVLPLNVTSTNSKSRKRKRIVIKKKLDARPIFDCEIGKSNMKNESVENDRISVDEKDLNKDFLQKRKKFKSSLLHSLDMCF